MTHIYEFAENTYSISQIFSTPEGGLPVNVYVVKGSNKTLLVDTGSAFIAKDTIEGISQLTSLSELDYIYITHMDADHWGGVAEILKVAPKVRLIGNPVVLGKGMGIYGVDPMRFAVALPGLEIDLGDRVLVSRPTIIEDGVTGWLFDTKTRTHFTSDAFGSIQFNGPQEYTDANSSEEFAKGFVMWHFMNFGIMPKLDRHLYRENIADMQKLDVKQIASAHGPIITKDIAQAYELMQGLPYIPQPQPEFPPIFQLK